MLTSCNRYGLTFKYHSECYNEHNGMGNCTHSSHGLHWNEFEFKRTADFRKKGTVIWSVNFYYAVSSFVCCCKSLIFR